MSRFWGERRGDVEPKDDSNAAVVSCARRDWKARACAFGSGYVVTLTPTGPQPPRVTAAIGDTVTFVNGDTVPHVVVVRRDGLTTPTIPSGQTYAHVLTTSGNLAYRQEGWPRVPRHDHSDAYRRRESRREAAIDPLWGLRRAEREGPPRPASPSRSNTGQTHAASTQRSEHWSRDRMALSRSSFGRGARTEYRASLLGKEFVSRGLVIEVRPALTVHILGPNCSHRQHRELYCPADAAHRSQNSRAHAVQPRERRLAPGRDACRQSRDRNGRAAVAGGTRPNAPATGAEPADDRTGPCAREQRVDPRDRGRRTAGPRRASRPSAARSNELEISEGAQAPFDVS